MTAEKLQDAISLLPSDLIAEADKMRCAKPKIIPWKRYAAMAACFAVVLSCGLFAFGLLVPMGGSTEKYAMDAAAPMEQEAPAAAAPVEEPAAEEAAPEHSANNSVTGNGTTRAPAEDSVCVLPEAASDSEVISRSVETPLKPSTVCFSSSTVVTLICSRPELEAYLADKDWIYDFTNFSTASEGYDESWFENHDLLILVVHASHAGTPWTVTAIEDVRGEDPMGWDWFVYFSNHGKEQTDHESTSFHLLTELEKGMISPDDSILTIAEISEDMTDDAP